MTSSPSREKSLQPSGGRPGRPRAGAAPAAAGQRPAPSLRFPEFRKAPGWATKPGDELFEQISNREAPPGLPILAITQEQGAVPRDTIDYHVSVTDKSVETYKEVQPGDFIISLRSFQGGIEYSEFHGICSPAYVILRKRTDLADLFYKHLFKSHRFIQQLTKNLEGLRDGKMVSYKQFSELLLPAPSLPEQRKIAACLASLDDLIADESRKLDALKAHKKGLMQQLFPREGETRPRLRFPEFRKAGEWTVKKLNELLREAKHRNRSLELGPSDVLSVSGEHGCVNQIEFMGRSYAGVSVKDYHIVERGDVVYTKSPLKRNPYGIIKENKGKRGIVSTLYAVYRPLPGCSATYLDHFFSGDYNLNAYLQPIVRKGAKNDMKVNNADVLKGDICVPSLPEQHKIASCLSSLDDLIATQSSKLEALRTHKRGLMQQLFPVPEENS